VIQVAFSEYQDLGQQGSAICQRSQCQRIAMQHLMNQGLFPHNATTKSIVK
jgi:hypothetical protein